MKRYSEFGRLNMIRQKGASLFIALIMLLVITLIAVTSMREVALEARITGNLVEQKRLASAAESALREGERRVLANVAPPETCSQAAVGSVVLCVDSIADDYDTDFGGAVTYSGLEEATSLDRNASWYIRDTGIVTSPDPECFLTGVNCTNYYEINSQARQGTGINCGEDAYCIRSTVAIIFD
jgi:type IV pilus assembly protein PilX